MNKMPGGIHLNDTHKKWGVAIFVLYFFQVFLGAVVHFFKIPALARKGIRAPQNYFHAIVGILIIGVSFYQVRYPRSFPLSTGADRFPRRFGQGSGRNGSYKRAGEAWVTARISCGSFGLWYVLPSMNAC